MIKIKDKILAAMAYALGVPALYLILSNKRKDQFLRYHGDQAFFLWLLILFGFFFFRLIVNFIWSKSYFPTLSLIELLFDLGLWGIALNRAVRILKT